jgi:hypothetical protein
MLAEAALAQIDGHGEIQTGGGDGVDAAGIPDRAHRIVVGQLINIVPGVIGHIGAVDLLDRQDIQRHRRRLMAGADLGAGLVIAHDGPQAVVFAGLVELRECRPAIAAIVVGMLQADRMADLVQDDGEAQAAGMQEVELRLHVVEIDVAFRLRIVAAGEAHVVEHVHIAQPAVAGIGIREDADAQRTELLHQLVAGQGDRQIGGALIGVRA